jgi:hypothetical protein
MHLRRDPAVDIRSANWDTFSQWELRPDRRAGYLGDADWAPVVSSDDDDDEDDDNEDEEEDDDEDEDDRVPV